jgi:serine acetyltransferase
MRRPVARRPPAPTGLGEWWRTCRADIAANRGYPKSVVILLGLRAAQLARSRRGPGWRLGYLAVAAVYKFGAEWLLGVEIPPSTSVGAGLRLRHGVGVVVNPAAVIGADVLIRHGVTLGNRLGADDCPTVERGAELGAGATVIGRVTVGRYARVGAGAVVVTDVPPYGTARGPRSDVEPRAAVTGDRS